MSKARAKDLPQFIKDWDEKIRFMRERLGEDNELGVFRRGVGPDPTGKQGAAFQEAAKKWHEHIKDPSRPSDHYRYAFKEWCDLLFDEFDDKVFRFFIDSSEQDFKNRAKGARSKEESILIDQPWFLTDHHTLVALDQDHPRTVRESIRTRQLDQKLYYMNVDSARAWSDLVIQGSYKIYDYCRDSIRSLVNSEEWKDLQNRNDYGMVIMLGGGGSTSKDVEIINSFIDLHETVEKTLKYILVDISSHMLSVSVSRLKKFFRSRRSSKLEISLGAVVLDILNLDVLKNFFRDGSRRNIWFLTGGTIGNLSERKFFQSLEAVARSGDLLVLGVDTFEMDQIEEAKEWIHKNYKIEELNEFLATPISILLHATIERGAQSNIVSYHPEKHMKVRAVEGRANGYSDLDNTLTAEVRLEVTPGQDEYLLLTSTRYHIDTLAKWCQDRGWELKLVVSPPNVKSSFRQLLLERK